MKLTVNPFVKTRPQTALSQRNITNTTTGEFVIIREPNITAVPFPNGTVLFQNLIIDWVGAGYQ